MSAATPMDDILAFLPCATPDAWLDEAVLQQDILLIDHANCEKKAAATAMSLLYKFSEHTELLRKMSHLAREELLHFEQVVNLLAQRRIRYIHLGASRYAGGLRDQLRKDAKGQLIDTLIVGAFVEARSCERRFYQGLLRSEARHFQDYLSLAALYSEEDIGPHVQRIRAVEEQLITSEDPVFRFHSGVPPR
jgi:tRNA-(ms[2]io[6]A)-hydroxylase